MVCRVLLYSSTIFKGVAPICTVLWWCKSFPIRLVHVSLMDVPEQCERTCLESVQDPEIAGLIIGDISFQPLFV